MKSIAAQAWRLRMLARDGRRLLGGIVRTGAWAVAPRSPGAALAVLAGEPLALPGVPAAYHVRVHNGGSRRARLQLSVRGSDDRSDGRRFEMRWEAALDADTAGDWWVRSCWQGDAELLTEPPSDLPVHWHAEPDGSWTIEVDMRDTDRQTTDRLVIAGTFIS